MSLDYCGRALGTRQRLPGSSPLATFGSTLGPIGLHLPRVYCPWQQSELQWACVSFSGLLLPPAFWCRLASLAAGCVATIASPLYSNGVSGRFGAMRANLLRPMDAYASPPLPPLDTWSSPTSKQVQRFSFLLPRPMGNWTDGQMRNGPMALSSGLKYPCAAHTAMAPDCHSSNRGLVHLPHYCRAISQSRQSSARWCFEKQVLFEKHVGEESTRGNRSSDWPPTAVKEVVTSIPLRQAASRMALQAQGLSDAAMYPVRPCARQDGAWPLIVRLLVLLC